MTLTEHSINDKLAEALKKTRFAWRGANAVRSEELDVFEGSSERPDILVAESNVSPVVIETEVSPAATVEDEARARLGKVVKPSMRKILSAVAVKLPSRFRSKSGKQLLIEIENADDIEIALFTGDDSDHFVRWPSSGWIKGGISELSWLVQTASVPPQVIDEAADTLIEGVSAASGLLSEASDTYPGLIERMCRELYQSNSEQSRRMAATVLANAFVFHQVLAGGPGALSEVESIEELRISRKGLNSKTILDEWDKILKINYWPIFDIASRLLSRVPPMYAESILSRLSSTASKLISLGVMRSHDLTGAVFQRLIVDRKFLAAFYTTPPSAALLAALAIRKELMLGGRNWGDVGSVKSLKVADFACGTGTLLTSAYQRIGFLHEVNGGNIEAVHPEMMAHSIIGCDVLPAAAHLTASMLAGAHPTVKYDGGAILSVPYGKQPNNEYALGSLDLLDPQGRLEVLAITASALQATGVAEKKDWVALPDESLDVILMNPPFTRATGHEGAKIGVPVPMFAAFESSSDAQRAMSRAVSKLAKGTCYHGNAGEASLFLALADRKLKKGGMLALVMPLSLLSGEAWSKSRELLAKSYEDLVVISISGEEDGDLSFSADTGMGECLVVGKKRENGRNNGGSSRAIFGVLAERPSNTIVGSHIADTITAKRLTGIRKLEDGPLGGTTMYFGNRSAGEIIEAPVSNSDAWGISRIADLSLAQTAFQLVQRNRVWLPTMDEADAVALPITKVGEIGSVGPYHADINWSDSKGGIRGPFEIHPLQSGHISTYPVLWAHHADRERTMIFEADCEAVMRVGKDAEQHRLITSKAKEIWKSASHCHFNRDFRFNSQSTGMQFTERKTIGGRAWISISLDTIESEKSLTLWSNSTLGLLIHWWNSNKQQSGRGVSGREMLHSLPIINLTDLSGNQLAEMVNIFDTMCTKPLLTFNEIDHDPVRREIDELLARKVFGFPEYILADNGPLDLLRKKLSREPSIRGGK